MKRYKVNRSRFSRQSLFFASITNYPILLMTTTVPFSEFAALPGGLFLLPG
jgi:hypothetical protein